MNVPRVVVLAEPESLFLPNMLARLAETQPLSAIIEVPPPPLRVAVRRAWNAFGLRAIASIVAAEAAARIVDRGSADRFYSLGKVARRLHIPHERVSGLNTSECAETIRRHRPDVVFAQVSRLIGPELLSVAPFWNKHCSLLPAYAGVFPVFWALLHDEPELGVTVHVMNEEFDGGTILQQASVGADGHDFFSAYHVLHDEVVVLLARALRGDFAGERPMRTEPSYYSYPRRADRAAFVSAGRRFGRPFRLHAPVRFERQAAAGRSRSASRPSSAS